MKLLFDANLSPALIAAVDDLYPGSIHVFDHGDIVSDDAAIWDFAMREGYVIATKDTDFLDLSFLRGAPPKVVLLRTGNVPTSRIVFLLRLRADRVHHFVEDLDESVLIIER